jgi:hypothetical protein
VVFALDLGLGALFIGDYLLGQPIERFSRFIDLDAELNLPTWYASVLWFGVAALMWIVTTRLIQRARRSSWVLLLLPTIFLLFSLDEVASLHEGLGGVLDRIVLDVPRSMTVLPRTGVLAIVFGIPFIVASVLLFVAVRPFLGTYRRPFNTTILGMALVLAGAFGVELMSNFVEPSSLLEAFEVLLEEELELVGATLILWGTFELGRESGAFARAFGVRTSSGAD